jgi:orotidine-5'-phosphate decarboxylase
LKPQLAFFLAQGSRGIALLESFIDEFRRDYTIILDGKFNEIENSLKAYLKFVFSTLQAHGVTINPFLGEKTLELTFETCAREVGSKGRVYVLCVTSENSQSTLSYMQKNHIHIMNACSQVRDQLFDKEPSLKKIAGVVIGANRHEVLLSEEIKQSGLSILSPGLGAQNADWDIIKKCSALKNEIIFPMSRGIFEGGNISLEKVIEKYLSIKRYF